jgi:hypothetical protein
LDYIFFMIPVIVLGQNPSAGTLMRASEFLHGK